jgi:hypothetical protein
MKRHVYSSLKAFYDDIQNVVKTPRFESDKRNDDAKFNGLSLAEINRNQFSYPFGVEKLKAFNDFKVEKDIKVKYWSDLDGQEIDIDRMLEDRNFLLDIRKKRLLPKTIDIYVNIGEGCYTNYNDLLCKTFAALKIVDKLETIGVRCAVYACLSFIPVYSKGYPGENDMIEICVKNHADNVNLGALCTAISPWMLRYWMMLFVIGRYPGVNVGVARPQRMPADTTGIVIDFGFCLTRDTANKFIESIKL